MHGARCRHVRLLSCSTLLTCPAPPLLTQIKAIISNAPTRWGAQVHVLRSIVASKDAIQLACSDSQAWTAASGSAQHAKQMHKAAVGFRISFWDDADAVLALANPILDAISQVEADQPLLSQMRPVWRKLETHFEAFCADTDQPAAARSGKLVELFGERRSKHYLPAFDAAYVLDPIHFTLDEGSGQWAPPCGELTSEERAACRLQFIRLAAAKSSDEQAALSTEWARYQLGSLPADLCDVLPHLTARSHRADGRVMIADVTERRAFWRLTGSEKFPWLARAAERLLAMHVTTAACERNWSQWGLVFTPRRNRLTIDRAEKLVYVRGNLQQQHGAAGDSSYEVTMRVLAEAEAAAPAALPLAPVPAPEDSRPARRRRTDV